KAETDDPAVPEVREENRVGIGIIWIRLRPVISGPVVGRGLGDNRGRIVYRDVDGLRARRRDRKCRVLALNHAVGRNRDSDSVIRSEIAGAIGLSSETLNRVQD